VWFSHFVCLFIVIREKDIDIAFAQHSIDEYKVVLCFIIFIYSHYTAGFAKFTRYLTGFNTVVIMRLFGMY